MKYAILAAAAALPIAACAGMQAKLTEAGVTADVQNCAKYAALDEVERADSYGVALLVKIGRAGVGCYMAGKQIVAIPDGQPVPRAAETIVSPDEAADAVAIGDEL